jgi:hypothetical protein
MKFYIAARYGRRDDAKKLAALLIELGHEVTSRWITSEEHINGTKAECALVDFRDVMMCETLVSIQEEPRGAAGGRGGRHIEFGMALATSKKVIAVGPRETIFHELEQVVHYDNLDQFLQAELGVAY